MFQTEKAMYQSMKKATSNRVHWTRVEAWAGFGIPDVNGAFPSGEFWIENKVCSTKAFQPIKLWRPAQIAWQTKRSALLTNVFNLVSRPRAGTVEIYSCAKLLDLVTNVSCQPDFVLTAPVKWDLLLDHIEEALRACKV